MPSVKTIERRLTQATSNVRREIMADFRRTVDSWEHPVNFRSKVSASGGNFTLYVYTADEVYKYVNDGTSPHLIVAKDAPRLWVRTGYTPKTRPGSIASGPSRYNGPVLFPRLVKHPGSKARRFNEQIADKHRAAIRAAFVVALTSFR